MKRITASQKVAQLDRRIAKLENLIIATDRNWIESKIEEFEDTLKGARKKNKKSLTNIGEAFKEAGIESTGDIKNVVKESERPSSEPLEKEVTKKVESLPSFKRKVDYLSDVWESRFRGSLKGKTATAIIEYDSIIAVAVVKGLIVAVKSSVGSFWLFSIASHLLTALLVGMVLILVFVDLRAFQRIKDFISRKMPFSKVRTAVSIESLPPIAILD